MKYVKDPHFPIPTGPPWVEENDTLQALEFAAKELKVDIFRDFARRFPHFFGSNVVSFTSFTMKRGDFTGERTIQSH